MRRLLLAAMVLAIPVVASAHVTVRPRESKPGVEEKYTVRVPTEGKVATTSVLLEVPDGVAVSDVPTPEGATRDLKRAGDRIVAITWTKEIKPKESAEFLFVARNPSAAGQITWKVRQHYADATFSDWTPATKLLPASTETGAPAQPVASSGEAAKIRHSHTSSRPRRPAGP